MATFLMACSKLEAMAIYLVKQACGNDKLAYLYELFCNVISSNQVLDVIVDSKARVVVPRFSDLPTALQSSALNSLHNFKFT